MNCNTMITRRLLLYELNSIQVQQLLLVLKLPLLNEYWKKKSFPEIDGEILSLVQSENDLADSYFPIDLVPLLVTRRAVKYLLEEYIPQGVPISLLQDKIVVEPPKQSVSTQMKKVNIVERNHEDKPSLSGKTAKGKHLMSGFLFENDHKRKKAESNTNAKVSVSFSLVSPEEISRDIISSVKNSKALVSSLKNDPNNNQTIPQTLISNREIEAEGCVGEFEEELQEGSEDQNNIQKKLRKKTTNQLIQVLTRHQKKKLEIHLICPVLNLILFRFCNFSTNFTRLYEFHENFHITKILMDLIIFADKRLEHAIVADVIVLEEIIKVDRELLLIWLKFCISSADHTYFQIETTQKLQILFTEIVDCIFELFITQDNNSSAVKQTVLSVCEIIQVHVKCKEEFWDEGFVDKINDSIDTILAK